MKRLFLIILILIGIITPDYLNAAGIEWWARKTLSTGSGKKMVVVASRNLSETTAREVVATGARAVLRGGGRPLGMAHPLVGTLMLAVGLYSMYVDLDEIIDPFIDDPNLIDPTTIVDTYVFNSPQGQFEVSVTRGPIVCTTCGNQSTRIFKVNWNNGVVQVSQHYSCCEKIGGSRYFTIAYPGGTVVPSPLVADGGDGLSLIAGNNVTLVSKNTVGEIDEDYLDDIIQAIPIEDIQNADVTIVEDNNVPQTAQEGPSITPTVTVIETPVNDPDTQTDVDPVTGEPTDTEVEPGTDQDSMTVPGQPGIPPLDTTIEEPEEKSIPDLLSDWLSNAPFMAIITDMEVTAAGGQSEFIIPLPEVLGGTATMDFGEWSDLWQAMGAIIIAVAYIYGAMIIFGGKS